MKKDEVWRMIEIYFAGQQLNNSSLHMLTGGRSK